MKQWRLHGWPILILLWAVTTWLVTFIVPDTLLRAIVVLSFLIFCPGMALSRFLQLKDVAVELIIGIALSITLDTIVACLLLYAGKWSPTIVLELLVVLSVAGAVGQLVMERMLSANIQPIAANTPIPVDVRRQSMWETLILPTTPIPVDIRDKDTVPMKQIARRNAAFADISEKDTIETQQIYSGKTRSRDIAEMETSEIQQISSWGIRSRSIPEMETVTMRKMQKHPVNARQHVPERETIEMLQIQKSTMNASDMETEAVQQVFQRKHRLIAVKRDVEDIETQHMTQHKATPEIIDLETIETQQAPLQKAPLHGISDQAQFYKRADIL